MFVDICQTISNFYPELLSKSMVLEIAIGIKVIKNKKDTDNLKIINVFVDFGGVKTPSKVEVAGVERLFIMRQS